MAGVRRQIKEARDAIAVKEREAAAASASARERFDELKAAQAERRETLDGLESRSQALSDNLAGISEQMTAAGSTPPATAPAPLTPGQSADYISESQASIPAERPAAVQAAIEAANSIATTPYIWGGGHGSFSSSGYDCSGAVSFALNGGGFLSSPLDSTGLETWGEAGAGQWITVYANAGHAWMIIAGLAFDTVGGPGPRWHSSPVDSPEGFVARHPSRLLRSRLGRGRLGGLELAAECAPGGHAAGRDVDDPLEPLALQDRGREAAAFARLADGRHRPVAGKLVDPLRQLGVGDMDRPAGYGRTRTRRRCGRRRPAAGRRRRASAASPAASIASIRLTGRSSARQALIPPPRKPRTVIPTAASSSAASSSLPSEAATITTSASGGITWATLVANPVS